MVACGMWYTQVALLVCSKLQSQVDARVAAGLGSIAWLVAVSRCVVSELQVNGRCVPERSGWSAGRASDRDHQEPQCWKREPDATPSMLRPFPSNTILE
jgi:hypothetical protein